MTIYTNNRTKVNYRRIYKNYHGSIPKEPNGRAYEIHHIDGNSHNNDISNLIAITLQEHYDIHFERGEFRACTRIAQKLKLSPDEISKLASLGQRQLVEAGKHHFQKRPDGTSISSDLRSSGTYINPFATREDGSSVAKDLVDSGKHHMLTRADGSSIMSDKTAAGLNPLQKRFDGSSVQQDLVKGGKHHLLKRADGTSLASERLASGEHHWVNNHPSKKLWTCSNCSKSGYGSSNYTRWHSEDSPTSCWNKS